MLFRPFRVPEWCSVASGAVLLLVLHLLSLPVFLQAVGAGTDVYLFLAGMMLLAECARIEGVFDWIAVHALRAARDGRGRLFFLVYAAGVVVTVVLSNDATAVVLTPAIAAVVRRTNADPLPYVLICALVANAASFVLPISNPANLVIFGAAIPALAQWLAIFTLPSLASIVLTYYALRLLMRASLAGSLEAETEAAELSAGGKLALAGIAASGTGLIAASALHFNLGATIAVFGFGTAAVLALRERAHALQALRSVSWSVLVLVAALFVLVRAADNHGLHHLEATVSTALMHLPRLQGVFGTAILCALGGNVINNLPAGLIAASGLATLPSETALHAAVTVGIDLGPNLSVTGSLATLLWLIVLRREKIAVSAWTFLRIGAIVMPAALLPAIAMLALTGR